MEYMIDTQKLVVGQIVYMVADVAGRYGKVIRVGTDGVDVDMRYESKLEIWKFDANGKACDSRSAGYVPDIWEPDGIPAFHGAPWELKR
jgi:hypothetical protein